MTDPLICYCGHRHTADSNREDAGCPCNDAHDWAAPRAEGLNEAVALLRDAQPNGMTIAPVEWQRRRRDLIAALDFDEIAEAVAVFSRSSDDGHYQGDACYTASEWAAPRAEGLDGDELLSALSDILRWTKPGSLFMDGTHGYSPAGPEKVARLHNRARAAFGDAPLLPSRPSDERVPESEEPR